MAEDWIVDVRKYASDADENIVAGIVRYCGIALRTRDGQLVAMSDKKERELVRQNYLKKKLGLTQDDATLDAAVKDVGVRMKADRTKNRVTVYYLLAEQFGKLGVFAGKTAAKAPAAKKPAAPKTAVAKAPAAKAVAPKAAAPKAVAAKKPAPKKAAVASAAVAGAGIAGAAGLAGMSAPAKAASGASAAATGAVASTTSAVAAPVAAVAATAAVAAAPIAAMSATPTPAPAAPAPAHAPKVAGIPEPDDRNVIFSTGCLAAAAVIAAIIIAALLAWFVMRDKPAAPAAVVATAPVAAPAPAPVVPEPAPAAPEGAGVIAEERDAKPMLKVYFDTGKSIVTPEFTAAAAPVLAYVKANPTATLAISGYNDPTGNAVRNAALSKKRAENVKAALETLGVPADKALLEKPAEASGTGATNAESRRVEVVIK